MAKMNYITNTNRVSTSALYSGDFIAHHGIKGQRWGIRRYQNEDGSLTPAGEKRYSGKNGDEKRRRDVARAEYKNTRNALAKRYAETDAKYDKNRDKNIYGFESGSLKDRAKNHIKNEYAREKALNKIDQQKLDAKRRYRQQLGKKKVDTLAMRITQRGIDDISNQSLEDFTKDYILTLGSDVLGSAKSYVENR